MHRQFSLDFLTFARYLDVILSYFVFKVGIYQTKTEDHIPQDETTWKYLLGLIIK